MEQKQSAVPSLICSACRAGFLNESHISCILDGCNKVFHYQCIGLTEVSMEIRDTWTCPDCRCAAKKGGDNSSTPVRYNPSTSSNVTLRKHQAQNNYEHVTGESLSKLMSEIRLLREDVSSIKSKIDNAFLAVSRCEERIDAFASNLTDYGNRLRVAEEKAAEVNVLKATIVDLQHQFNYQMQQLLRSDIEIVGIPEHQSESPLHIVKVAAAKMGVGLEDGDIEYASRAGKRRQEDNRTSSSRPLVVRFSRRKVRDDFYKSARSRRLNTSDIGLDGPSLRIYFNERLTRENRLLFRDCRARAAEAGFRHCWTQGGIIYVRKREGKGVGSEAIPIKTYEDLNCLNCNLALEDTTGVATQDPCITLSV